MDAGPATNGPMGSPAGTVAAAVSPIPAAAAAATSWVASPKPNRLRSSVRSNASPQRPSSSLGSSSSSPGGSQASVSPFNRQKGNLVGSPSEPEEAKLARLDVGTYRETAICQRLVKGTKELRCAAVKLKDFFLSLAKGSECESATTTSLSNRSEMRLVLYGLCKDLEQAGKSISDIVQTLSSCTVGSFAHVHYKKLEELASLIRQDVRSLSDISWSVWRFPSDAVARSRCADADMSLSSHLHETQVILRPFITYTQDGTSYGSNWSEFIARKERLTADPKAVGIYDIATRITHSLRSLLHQDEVTTVEGDTASYGTECPFMGVEARAANERRKFTDQLIEQAQGRAHREEDVSKQLRILQTVAEFRVQASRLQVTEKQYIADLSSTESLLCSDQEVSKDHAEEQLIDNFMNNWQAEWDEWRRILSSSGQSGADNSNLKEVNQKIAKTNGGSNMTEAVSAKNDMKDINKPNKPATQPSEAKIDQPESRHLQTLESRAEDFSDSLLQLLELFENRSTEQNNKRMLERVISMADLKRFAPVDDVSVRAKYDALDIWDEPLIEAGRERPSARTPSNPTVLYAPKVTKTSNIHSSLRTPRGQQPVQAEGYSLKAATLNQLVRCVTSESSHDLGFVKTFILTFQSFTTPEQLWEKLMQRYNVPQWTQGTRSDADWQKHTVVPIRLRVINFIKMWLEMHITDLNYFLIRDISDFIDGRLIKDGHTKWATTLSRLLHRQISARQAEDEAKRSKKARIANALNKMGASEFILDLPLDTIIQHLSMIEFNIYQSIKPIELLNQSWNKPKLKYRAPNVLNFIKRFNEVSQWTATNILKEPKLKQRGRLMTKFLSIALGCYAINNFNTALAIISGLNSSAVHRLKFTKAEVPERLWTELEQVELSLGGKNYSNYRERLHSVNPPLLPYLGVYLTDLTFIDDGNPDYIDSLINFKKRELVYDVLREIVQYQQRGYNFPTDGSILNVLNALHFIADAEKLWALSLQREPRNAERADLP